MKGPKGELICDVCSKLIELFTARYTGCEPKKHMHWDCSPQSRLIRTKKSVTQLFDEIREALKEIK